MLAGVSCVPLQSYLQAQFPHDTGPSEPAVAVRAENQRRHDQCAAQGHFLMSRTS